MTKSPPSPTDEKEEVDSQAKEEQQYLSKVGWRALFGFTTRQHLPILCCGLLGALIAAASIPVFAIIYGLIFRDYADFGAGNIDGSQLRSNVSRFCLILTGVAALNSIANSFYFFFFLTFGEIQARSARNKIFDALIRKDIAWYDTRQTGIAAFLPGIQMHIRDLQLSLSAPFGEGTQCAIQGLASLGVAFYFCWNLTFLILCTVPLIYLVESFVGHRLSIRAKEQAEKLQAALKYLTTAIMSIETVKCFNGEQYELRMFTSMTALAARVYLDVANLRSIQIGAMQFFTLSVFVQGFWYGTYLVRAGDRSVNQVITTFWAALLAIQGITGFLPQVIVLQKGKGAGARLQMLLEHMSMNDQCQETEGDLKPLRCPGDVEFRKVTFSYPTRPDEVAIRDISLFFPAGETTFVIGMSGSGKSTLGQLIVRFYRPLSGQIFLDRNALDTLDVSWLRQNVTLVEQHSVLFDDTIRENIALGKPGELSFQEIEEAIKFAILEPTVQGLPDGMDTELGMKDSSLSGGQRQRMALARAKVRDPPVLILDESTSALDYVTRAAILQAIRYWRKGKTTIVITHDIAQIQANEFLYLMKNSEVVQEGYRKELEGQSGAFHDLLAAHEVAEEAASDDDDYSSDDEDTDELISLYDEAAWHLNGPMYRPMSAVLFGENVLSRFLQSGRESFAASVIAGSEKRFTKQEPIEMDIVADLEAPVAGINHTAMNMPPANILPDHRVSQLLDRPWRSSSKVSQTRRLSRVISYNRPMPLQMEHGSRPISLATLTNASRKNSYPNTQRSSQADIYTASRRNSRPDTGLNSLIKSSTATAQEQKLSRRERFQEKLRIKRLRGDSKGNSSGDSLSIMHILKSVWPRLNWRSRVQLGLAIFSGVVHAACTPTFAWVFAKLLTTFYTTEDTHRQALIYAMAILGIAFVDGVAAYMLFFLSDAVAQAWAQALKVEAMQRILMQPRGFFDREENSMSRLAETLDHFAEEARNLPGRFSCLFFVIFLMIGISISWSLATSWQLALVALACGPALFAITKCYNMISSRWERLANEADDVVGQILHETFVNIRTVRCLNLEEHFRRKYKAATNNAVNVGIKRALYSGSIFGLNFSCVLFVAILLFWYGAVLVSKNQNTVSAITETFLILMLSVNQIAYMGHYITQVNMSRDAGSRLLRLARMPTTSHELDGTIHIQEAGDITFNKVNFTYPTRKDVQVLHDVSFNIPQGSCTAIVGSSGSGKSTIAALLLKLYQSDTNNTLDTVPSLLISNTDIKALNTSSLRARMAIVSQTPIIFPGTIAQNIAYGLSPSSPLASIESVRAAAHAAGVSDFIDSLPNGFRTLIGEGGTGLSGGQAQRLAIARALVRSPDILILDEATSALDVASAGIVRDTIRGLVRAGSVSPVVGVGKGKGVKRDMTVVIITHAREMMAIAEHIVVLDKGRVVEQGRFGELKRKKGGAFGRLLRGERDGEGGV